VVTKSDRKISPIFPQSKIKYFNAMNKYSDIIDRPYKGTEKHTHMSMMERAAQFASFAALSGHSDAILETGRRHIAGIV